MIKIKKIIIFLFSIILVFIFCNKDDNTIIIPQDAIRFRIIANSNQLEDQKEKITIKKELEPIFTDILKAKTKEESENLIGYNIPRIERVIEDYNKDYKINYGLNYFPEKNYKGLTYKEGEYESLVITLGDGLGDNWWCVLFPPLCLLEAKEEDIDEYTYSFYIKEVIDQYF